MKIIPFFQGEPSANAFLIIDGKKGLLIDCGPTDMAILNALGQHGIDLCGIVLTHGHYDHWAGIEPIIKDHPCPIYIHGKDATVLKNPTLSGSAAFGKGQTLLHPVKLIQEGDRIMVGALSGTIIHTPFHTAGSICIYFPLVEALFTGDTLFKEDVGRTDLPNSAPKLMASSLKKLKALPPPTEIFPGHGDVTTLKHELKHNRYVNV